MRTLLPPLARRLRRGAAATGPWSASRALLACGALAVAASLVGWTVGSGHRLGGVLAFFAVAGLAVLALALLQARVELLGFALALAGGPAAVVVAGASATAAASAGAALAGVHELARWSAERRVRVPGHAPEWARWRHLGVVLAGGWVTGVGVVALASGRLALPGWQAPLGALAAVAVAASVAAAARSRH